MGNSLQEQLLKAGLVNKSKAQQAKKQIRKKKRSKSSMAAQRDSVADAVSRAQAEKDARDRELNRQKHIKESAKARKLLLKQYIEKNRLNDPAAEEPYNFVHDGSIKRLRVNAKQRARLGVGRLAIVHVAERYSLVDSDVSKKILDMAPDTFVFIPEEDKQAEDDPYAGFQVPDDLMW